MDMKKVLALFVVLSIFSGSLHFPVEKVTAMVITDLDNDLVDDYVFACHKIVSDPWDRGVIYVYEKNQLKWYYHLSTVVKALTVFDIDSDGKKEIIVACDILLDKGDLYVFNNKGKLEWRKRLPGKPKSLYCYKNYVAVSLYGKGERIMIYNSREEKVKDFPVNGDVSAFEIKDVNNDGAEEIVVAGIVNNKWEHFLVVYDMDEPDHVKRVLWNYQTREHINDFVFHDIDGDGIQETIMGTYNSLYITRGGDLLGRIELPPPLLHVDIIGDQVLLVNQNTLFLINFSDILKLNGNTVFIGDFTDMVDGALKIAVKPQFLFLRDIDFDKKKEIVVGDGEVLEVHEMNEFAPPEIVITQPVALIREVEVTYATYERLDYGFRMKYPTDWEIGEDATVPALTFSSPTTSATVEITTRDVPDTMTLEEFTETAISEIEQEYTITEEGATTLAGNPAYQATYTQKFAQYTVKGIRTWTIKNNKAYVITYSAEMGQYVIAQRVYQEMIDSFEILGAAFMVKICEVQIDAPGDDNANLDQEWIKICNNGTADVDLSNWALINNAGAYYEFPDGFILRAGASVIVYTGAGEDTEAALFWEYPVEAWNNTSEVVTLQDSEGNTIDEYMWSPEAV
jgi:hypothetical protein